MVKGVEGEGICLVFPGMRATVWGIRCGLKALPWEKRALDSSPLPDQLFYSRGRRPFLRPYRGELISWRPLLVCFCHCNVLENFSGPMHSTVCVYNYIYIYIYIYIYTHTRTHWPLYYSGRKYLPHHYTTTTSLNRWDKAGWIHAFMFFMPNSDPTIWISQQKSRLIRPGNVFGESVWIVASISCS